MKEYKRDYFVLSNTFRELFKIKSSDIISNIISFNDNKECYQKLGIELSCTINVNDTDYLVGIYQYNIFIIPVKNIDNDFIDNLKNKHENLVLNFTLNVRPQILSKILLLQKNNPEENISEIKNLKNYYEYLDSYDFESNNNTITHDYLLIESIFKLLNIEIDNVITIMKNEIFDKYKNFNSRLSQFFKLVKKSSFIKNEIYYYGDDDLSLIPLELEKNNICIGYNNLSCSNEYFILLEEKNDVITVKYDTFSNLEHLKGYQTLTYLNAFENDKNIELIRSMNPVYNSKDFCFLDYYVFRHILISLVDMISGIKEDNKK